MSCQGWVNTAIATSALTNRLSMPLPFGGEAIDGVELTGDILVFGCLLYTGKVERRHHSGNHWRYQGHMMTCIIIIHMAKLDTLLFMFM